MTTQVLVQTGGNGGPGRPDRQVMFRALDAATAAHLIWGWRQRDARSITILTAPGSAAPHFALIDEEVPLFLAERIASERRVPQDWPDRWDRLLDCMERLAETVRWWEVAP